MRLPNLKIVLEWPDASPVHDLIERAATAAYADPEPLPQKPVDLVPEEWRWRLRRNAPPA